MAAKPRTSSRTFIACTAVSAMLCLGGCVSYTNVPEPTSAPAFESANHLMSIKVMQTALEEVLSRYPMSDAMGRFSVNLPAGTTLESAQRIVDDLPDGAVIPYEGMDSSIPMYHIGRIWIRASDAKVDVLYPARAFDGSSFMGTVTVWMRGGTAWRVTRIQHWAPGTIDTPPVYVPLPKEAIEAREMMNDEQDAAEAADPMAQPVPTPQATPEPVTMPEPESQPEPTGDPDATYRQVPVDD